METDITVQRKDWLEKLVYINPNEMSQAQSVVNSVNSIVYELLKNYFPEFKMRVIEPFVLQGSVADSTKVIAPNEFDYLIPMDLCDNCWNISLHCTNNLGSTEESPAPIINDTVLLKSSANKIHCRERSRNKNNNCRLNSRLMLIRRRSRCFKNGLRKDYRLRLHFENPISAENVFQGFQCIGKCKNSVGNNFVIVNWNWDQPAITLTVKYKLNDFADGPESTLSIDYVPAMCTAGRVFIVKNHDWRESYSFDELRLMTKIQQQAEPLFKVFKSVKALQVNAYGMLCSLYRSCDKFKERFWEMYESLSVPEVLYGTIEAPNKKELSILIRHFASDKNIVSCFLSQNLFSDSLFKFVHLKTYHLKLAMFHLYKQRDLLNANEETLFTEFVDVVEDFISKRFIPNCFNDKRLFVVKF